MPLTGLYRQSQVADAASSVAELVEEGWPQQAADDLVELLAELFDEGSNAAQDLLLLGFSDYNERLDQRLLDEFLLTPPFLTAPERMPQSRLPSPQSPRGYLLRAKMIRSAHP